MRLFIIITFIGRNNDSWGYQDDGHFWYPGSYERERNVKKPYGPVFTTGDTIGCCLNFTNNTVFYTKNGVNLGNYYFNTNTLFFKINKDLIFYNVF